MSDANVPAASSPKKKVIVVFRESQVMHLDAVAFGIRRHTGEKIDRSTILRLLVGRFIRAGLPINTAADLKRLRVVYDAGPE